YCFSNKSVDRKCPKVAQPVGSTGEQVIFGGIDAVFNKVDEIFQCVFFIDKPQVNTIFKVNDGITNIICRFNQEGKRVTYISNFLPCTHGNEPQLICNLFEYFHFCLENTKFLVSYISGGFMR